MSEKQDKKGKPEVGAPKKRAGKKGQLEALREQLAAKEDRLLRALAEHENYRKRAARELEEARRFATEELLKEMLPVLDSMEQALRVMHETEKTGPLLEGTEMIQRQLGEVLAKFGLVRIECLGKKFDPRYHQAVLQEETDAHAEGEVMEELRPGYLLHDRVIRASEVKVAKRVGKDAKGKPRKK